MYLEARLRAFAAVARQLSFSRAAEELGISQPAVSRHVSELERGMGVQLLVRDPRGATLTTAGEFLAGYVSRAEALLAQAQSGMRSIVNAEIGHLSLAASRTPGSYLLPKAIAAVKTMRPGLTIDLHLTNSAEAVELVRRHEAELGLVGGLTAAPDLQAFPLVEDTIVLIGPPEMAGRRLSARDLERETWIVREEGSATRATVEAACRNIGLSPRRQLQLPDWEMIKIAVAEGGGIAPISSLAIELEAAAGRIAVLDVPGWHVVRPLSIIRARDVPSTPLADDFLVALRRISGIGTPREQAIDALDHARRAGSSLSVTEARRSLEHGLTLLDSIRDPDEEDLRISAQLRSELAFWQVKGGDPDSAQRTIEEGMRPDLPRDAHADLLARSGWLAFRLGRLGDAVDRLEQALALARDTRTETVERRTMSDLALAYGAVGRNDEGVELMEEAMRLARTAGDHDLLLRSYNNLAVILAASDHPRARERGEQLIEEGLREARRIGDRHDNAWFATNRASDLTDRGRLSEALDVLSEGIELMRDLEEAGGYLPALDRLARIHLYLGNESAAMDALAEAAEATSASYPGLSADVALLRNLILWRRDPAAAANAVGQLAPQAPEDRELALICARMALRREDAAPLRDWARRWLDTAAPEVQGPLTRETALHAWLRALAHEDPALAMSQVAAVAEWLQAADYPLDAAEAWLDAAFLARRSERTRQAVTFLRRGRQLMATTGAQPLLDSVAD